MRAAFISRAFAPKNTIASVRLSKMVKYLVRKGWTITVFAEEIKGYDDLDSSLFSEEMGKVEIIRLSTKNKRKHGIEKSLEGNPSKTGESPIYSFLKSSSLIKGLNNFRKSVLFDLDFYSRFRQLMSSENFDKNFDLIFSSYVPLGAHWSAHFLKKLIPQKSIWIADFRDLLIDRKPYIFFLQPVLLAMQSWVVNRADGITTVSDGLRVRQIYHSSRLKHREDLIRTICNGFDPDDSNRISYQKDDNVILSFCYTGKLIPGFSDASMLFEILAALVHENCVEINELKFYFAGPAESFISLCSQARPFGMENIIINQGFVSHARALEIQKNCDFLLSLSWNTKRQQGILTGKLMEYIGMDRPIIGLITGDQMCSEISEILHKNNIGYTFYYADNDSAKSNLRECMMKFIQQKRKFGLISFSPDRKGVDYYSYNQITDRFIDFVEFIRDKS